MEVYKVDKGSEEYMDFNKTMSAKPGKDDVKDHPFITTDKKAKDGTLQKSKYIPIGSLEKWMDDVFAYQWSRCNVDIRVIENEVITSITLEAVHPVTGYLMKRSGVGGCAIPMNWIYVNDDKTKTRYKVPPTEWDIKNKKTEGITTASVISHSMAFKNAAKSYGEMMGRDLNREIEDEGDPDGYVSFSDVKALLQNAESEIEIQEVWDGIEEKWRKDKRIVTILKARQIELMDVNQDKQ